MIIYFTLDVVVERVQKEQDQSNAQLLTYGAFNLLVAQILLSEKKTA